MSSACRCGAVPERGLLTCHAERPPLSLCAPCYSDHIKVVHDGTGDFNQQAEDTESWRQIQVALNASGGAPVKGWFLLELPETVAGEPDEDDWGVIAFTTKEAEAVAWHAPDERRRSDYVELSRRTA